MEIDKIINNSLNITFSENKSLLEEIIDDLLDVMPEDERLFNASQQTEQEQKIINIVQRIASLSVLSSIHASKTMEYEHLKKKEASLTNSSKEKSSRLTLIKNQHSSEQNDQD